MTRDLASMSTTPLVIQYPCYCIPLLYNPHPTHTHRAALGIEEYSLSQTTLEQVFVLLAQDGEEGQGGVGVRAQASTRVRRLHAVVA